ncbi:MAG: hypothetical protein KF807_00115 [Xanthobacteraceae bacterium]|nr:hypothetical protein [Xanthobacteraceae bacterium]
MKPIKPTDVRYIKLGKGGSWAHDCFENSRVDFGHRAISHELGLKGSREEIIAFLVAQGRDKTTAANHAREVLEFYRQPETCLWITFADEHLYWTFANPEVTWVGGDGTDHGQRFRKCVGGWSNKDINGRPILSRELSSKLTQVAGHRGTVCSSKAADYAVRRINGIVEPILEKAAAATEALLKVIDEALKELHQDDFETLVDAILARGGWHRISRVGGTQKFFDLLVEQPTTGEVAAVQVKSSSNQKELDEYLEAFRDAETAYSRFFYVCHTSKKELVAPEDDEVQIWSGRALSEHVLRAGLQDWVFARVV